MLAFLLSSVSCKGSTTIPVFGRRFGIPTNPESFQPFIELGFPLAVAPLSFSERLFGDSRTILGISLPKGKNSSARQIGRLDLTRFLINRLSKLIRMNGTCELEINGLTYLIPIGTVVQGRAKLFTLFTFRIFADSRSEISSVEIVPSEPIALDGVSEGIALSFASEWITDRLGPERFNRAFFQHRFHSYAVWQLAVQFILLCGFICYLYWQMISDSSAGDHFDDLDAEVSSEKGWKFCHGDVFRAPNRAPLLAILAGAGFQMALMLVLFLVWRTFASIDQPPRRSFHVVAVLYSVTSVFAGLSSVAYGNALGIGKWLRLAFGAVLLIPAALALSFSICGIIGTVTDRVVSSVTVIGFLFFFGLMSVLNATVSAIGGFLSRKKMLLGDIPCQIAAVARGVPKLPLWANSLFLSLLIGFFSIAPLSVEVFYLLSAVWQSQIYCSYHLLLPTGLLLIGNIGGLTLLAVYVKLHCECHRWHWFSFLAPCSTGLWSIVCALWFYCWKVQSLGWFTPAYFFGISALFSALLSLISGAVGFFAATLFVRFLFSNLKLD
jgi:transmembrane 9 superfamily protein 2/4